MSKIRWWILILGPPMILAVSFSLSRWLRVERGGPPASNHFLIGQAEAAAAEPRRSSDASASLALACEKVSAQLSPRLGAECHTIVRPPFVLAGDLKEEELDGWYRETIGPAMRAMANGLLDTLPDRPITVLLFSGESSYEHYGEKLFGDRDVSIYGYYKPSARTLVMNIDTGGGTLVHELTHALVDFDFPEIPDWFNEGLASLYEQCRFYDDRNGPAIAGLENWRLPSLQKAIRAGKLRTLESLITGDDFRGPHQGLNYAQARYFCLYLERQGLLTKYYRLARQSHKEDPRGSRAVAAIVPDFSWPELNRKFQAWALTLEFQR